MYSSHFFTASVILDSINASMRPTVSVNCAFCAFITRFSSTSSLMDMEILLICLLPSSEPVEIVFTLYGGVADVAFVVASAA